jgi:hypothetical protein
VARYRNRINTTAYNRINNRKKKRRADCGHRKRQFSQCPGVRFSTSQKSKSIYIAESAFAQIHYNMNIYCAGEDYRVLAGFILNFKIEDRG